MLRFDTPSGAPVAFAPNRLIIAGWTGRDKAGIAEHIAELAEIGVPGPSATPLYYAAPASTLAQGAQIEALGPDTSGEAEAMLFDDGARVWVGLGSDHTDRDLERTCVARSKAVCAKPVAGSVWPFDEVKDHWDALRIRSELSEDGAHWQTYQEGALIELLPIATLAADAPGAGDDGRLGAGAAMLCGALPAQGGVRPTPWFRAELVDPELGRAIRFEYRTVALSIVA